MTQTLLPEMIRGSLQPVKEALREEKQLSKPTNWYDLADACESLAATVDSLQRATRRHLADSLEGGAAAALFRECLLVIDEALTVCGEIRKRITEPEPANGERVPIAKAVNAAVGQIQKVRAFYQNLLTWLDEARLQPITLPDDLDREPTQYLSSEEVLRELQMGDEA
jgi:hypothetical protein